MCVLGGRAGGRDHTYYILIVVVIIVAIGLTFQLIFCLLLFHIFVWPVCTGVRTTGVQDLKPNWYSTPM